MLREVKLEKLQYDSLYTKFLRTQANLGRGNSKFQGQEVEGQ